MSHLGWLATTYKIDGHEMNFNSNKTLASLFYRPIAVMEQTKFQVFWLLRIKLRSDCGLLEFEVNATNISSKLGRERGLEIWMLARINDLYRRMCGLGSGFSLSGMDIKWLLYPQLQYVSLVVMGIASENNNLTIMNKPRKCGIHKETFYLLVLHQGRPEHSHL